MSLAQCSVPVRLLSAWPILVLAVNALRREVNYENHSSAIGLSRRSGPGIAAWCLSSSKVKGSLFRRRRFRFDLDVQGHSDDASMTSGVLVLTEKRLLAYTDFHDCEDASLEIGTVAIRQLEPETRGGDSDAPKACITLTGCSDLACSEERQVWQACLTNITGEPSQEELESLSEWRAAIDSAYLARNKIAERFYPEVQRVVQEIQSSLPSSKMPRSFSPFITTIAHPMLRNFSEITHSFKAGVVPYLPRKNSGSGATFFFSMDKKFLAKRVRIEEMTALWNMAKSGEYMKRFSFSHKPVQPILIPIYLAFLSKTNGDPWIIMAAATLPADIEKHVPLDAQRFFEDIKPPPLTSDYAKLSPFLLVTHRQLGLHFSSFSNWNAAVNKLDSDAMFLEDNQLVDYSAILQGAIFPKNDTAVSEMKTAVRGTGCSVGCSMPPAPRFVDVTDMMTDTSEISKSFRCCCQELRPGDSLVLRSPCALVNLQKGRRSMFWKQTGCGNLMMGEIGDWHHFRNPKLRTLGFTQGRCIVGLNVWPMSTNPFGHLPDIIGPEAAFGIVPPPPPPPMCSVMCASLLDYLLPMNVLNKVENVVLSLYYLDLKWTNYRRKMLTALNCLGRAAMTSKYGVFLISHHSRPFFNTPEFAPGCEDMIDGFANLNLDEAMIQNLTLVPRHPWFGRA